MALSKSLRSKLDAFLAAPASAEDGGWAKVGAEDVSQLLDIVRDLVAAKYEADVDGDVPLSVHVIDRTRFEPHPFVLLPHLRGEAVHDLRAIQANLRYALCNLNLAQRQVEQVQHTLDHGVIEAMQEGGPVFYGKQAYVRRQPDAHYAPLLDAVKQEVATLLAPQSLTALLNDRTAKDTWTAQVTQQLQAKFNLATVVRAYRQTKDKTRGVVAVELTGLRQPPAEYGPMVHLTQTLEG